VAALNGPQDATQSMAQEYQLRRDMLYSALEESPYVKAFKAHGAFYLWARIQDDWPGYSGKKDDWSMTNYLIDKSAIGSAPGSAFGAAGEGYIRFAFSCSTAQVKEASGLLPDVLRTAGK
jgi:aspartate/methionine/tyrosine aminotransferase